MIVRADDTDPLIHLARLDARIAIKERSLRILTSYRTADPSRRTDHVRADILTRREELRLLSTRRTELATAIAQQQEADDAPTPQPIS